MISRTLPASPANPLEDLPAPVAADMEALDCLIHERLHSDAGLIRHVAEHIINAGGKRIRPLLVLLMSRALGYEGQDHHVLAAIVELVHTASLLHDDVVDESRLRRGLESANARFGNAAAVLVGDFMHTRAFRMMLSLNNMHVMEILADATNTIVEGEVMQLMNAGRSDMDEVAYFRIIHAKTARLFEAACALGVSAAGHSDRFHAAASTYGRALGMAFQLVDDCLDYAGDANTLGKHIGNDLQEGKMTLPLIYLMQHATANEKSRIRDYIERGEKAHFDAIIHAVRQSGALRYVSRKAAEKAGEAVRAIEGFPESACKDSLVRLCRFAVERQY